MFLSKMNYRYRYRYSKSIPHPRKYPNHTSFNISLFFGLFCSLLSPILSALILARKGPSHQSSLTIVVPYDIYICL